MLALAIQFDGSLQQLVAHEIAVERVAGAQHRRRGIEAHQQTAPAGCRVRMACDDAFQQIAGLGVTLPAPVEDWYEMTKLGLLSRAVNPDWNKMTAEIFNPGLNPEDVRVVADAILYKPIDVPSL